MAALMELIAGEAAAILGAISTDDLEALSDRARFPAHLELGPGLDPTWLDLFSEAARVVTGSGEPVDFLDARRELAGAADAAGPADVAGRNVERIDPRWVAAIARLTDQDILAVAGRWLDLLGEEYGTLPREEKPWIRQLAGDVVRFCRVAERAPEVVFAWSL